MVNKLICWLLNHNHVFREIIWTGNNELTVVLECSRCGDLRQLAFKRPHNWNEIPF